MFGIIGINSVSQIILSIARRQYADIPFFYIDDNPAKWNTVLQDIEVTDSCKTVEEKIINSGSDFMLSISIGEKNLTKRKELFHRFNQYQNVSFPVIKHESTLISELAKIDAANILSFGAIIGHNAVLKPNSIIWSGAVVEHDCVIGESCYISPNATISGYVTIDDCTLIGSGAVILPEINIGKNCLIGAGAVVTKNVPDNTIVVGVPAKSI